MTLIVVAFATQYNKQIRYRPLAKKVAECGVFGVASDEYLSYALENRKRLTTSWTKDGDLLVNEYLERYKQSKISKNSVRRGSANTDNGQAMNTMTRTGHSFPLRRWRWQSVGQSVGDG